MDVNEVKRIIAETVKETLGSLAALAPKPKPKPKPKPAAPLSPRELTEDEKVVRRFAFLREHNGLMDEGRIDRATGQIHWRSGRR